MDTCCLNRPFDGPEQLRVRAEAAAVMEILQGVSDGNYQLISSSILEWEISKHPDHLKKLELKKMLTLASSHIEFQDSIVERSRVLSSFGFNSYDAYHLASAEAAGVNCFLTTDDKLSKLAQKFQDKLIVPVMNPVQWLWSQIK